MSTRLELAGRGWRQLWTFCCAGLFVAGGLLARATTIVPPDFETLVNESDVIVQVVAKRVTTEKRVGPRGSKIYTLVEFEVLEAIAGKAPATLTLQFLGGRVGDEVMSVGGMPQFQVGDEDILFVRDNGHTICPLYGMMYGRYLVSAEAQSGRKFVARSDGEPLRSVAEISTPVVHAGAGGPRPQGAAPAASALQPAEFSSQIRAAIRPDARVHRAR